ncbi:MAG TPA: glycoside hydrolase family 28 protein [Thermoanaerobaculia bacterium]|nr:glycoside hydrolase family 28 protein [Thermoanaerobaculia bacterium]
MRTSRNGRAFVAALALAVVVAPVLLAQGTTVPAGDDPWARLPDVLSRIVAPEFPARDFLVTRFGAKGDGKRDASEAFRRAIEACSRAGGGRVVVPPGEFVTGPIHLKSRVNLHLQKGAVVRFLTDPALYLPPVLTRWEGVELMGYSPLVYALDEESIAVTGEGTLDGGASEEKWWPWKGKGPEGQRADRDRLLRLAEDGVPVKDRVFGAGNRLRPPFIEPYRCRNVLIEGITITNAPFWVIHPVLSQNVTVRNVKVVSHGPNNDGCDPESSSDVLIEDSLFDTGDDCIALKSGRNADGRRLATPVERVVVRRCTMKAGHGGVTIGSEISGGARDVFVEKCEMSSPDLERGLRIKTNAMRGGVVENVFVRDVTIGQVGNAIDVDMLYEEGAAGAFLPTVRNVRVERMTVEKAAYALFLRAIDGAPIRGLSVKDSTFRNVAKGNRIEGTVDVDLRNVTLLPSPAAKKDAPAPAATPAPQR